MDDGLSDGFQRVFVDVLHVVVDGVPCGSEAAGGAVGIEGDDVDGGDAGGLVERHVVVGDIAAFTVGEVAGIAGCLGGCPHFVDDGIGVLHGHAFFEELGAFASDHVEEDAVTGFVALGQVGSEMLGAECPGVAGVFTVCLPHGEAPVFGVEADEVDADGEWRVER